MQIRPTVLIAFFYKIVQGFCQAYFTVYIYFTSERRHNTRSSSQTQLEEPICRTKILQSSFFPSCIEIWNGLDPDLQNTDSYNEFKGKISSFIKTKSNVKLLSRLRFNFNHLNKHKVCHGFKEGTNCMCDCGSVTKTTLHFLLQCQQCQRKRLELLSSIYSLDPKIRNLSYSKLLLLLSYGSKFYSFKTYREIIKLTMKFGNHINVLNNLFFDQYFPRHLNIYEEIRYFSLKF